ncbi:anti-sigma-B factor antagonist [Collibacillus ludicampi]|uniref:Anti-sigma-B factor antagonist n=1 Tax=Collibacillus ludicampi TaxID=2771369 RepID=A0AAV4LCU6_9BACL|nr:STAS domain-containing protein [Collibacillus ludicampi]GIM45551.1 anti-sigma-B factor antagonist [Collibacillus ludicampi]
MFEFQIIPGEEKTQVAFKGDMDIEITEVMEEEILPALQQYPCVEINFSQVPFVDSTGIGLFINLVEKLKENNVRIQITHLCPQVSEIFDLLQIPDILGREIFVDHPSINPGSLTP